MQVNPSPSLQSCPHKVRRPPGQNLHPPRSPNHNAIFPTAPPALLSTDGHLLSLFILSPCHTNPVSPAQFHLDLISLSTARTPSGGNRPFQR